MIEKDFDRVDKGDLHNLVASATPEGRTIDYKDILPGGKDEDRKEFLADASSFANASGGDLIFGVSEKRDAAGQPTGIPESVNGLAGINADAEIRRLEDILRNGISPRVPSLRIKAVSGFPNGPAILIRIPRSWASPHMVTFKGTSRFYSRTSAGKHQLDVSEIRAAFLASDSMSEKMAQFRTDRISKLVAGETPVQSKNEPTVVLHLLPLQSFAASATVDLSPTTHLSSENFHVMYGNVPTHRHFNFDGLIAYDELFNRTGQTTSFSYLQIFRNGAIEAVSTELTTDQGFYPNFAEGRVIEALPKYIALLEKLGVSYPFFVAITVIFVKGHVPHSRYIPQNVQFGKPIDREVLMVPAIALEEPPTDIPRVLKPAFDSIWQAGGWPHSPYYDASGKRREVIE